MNNSFKICEKFLKQLENLYQLSTQGEDLEHLHIEADNILMKVARNTTLNSKQRLLLVQAYDKIPKYYA